MHRVRVGGGRRDQGVTALVVRGDLLLLLGHDPGPLLRAGHDAVDRLVQGEVVDQLLVGAGRQQRRLVEDVRQVGTGEAGSPLGDGPEVDVRRDRLALLVHLEDVQAALQVRALDRDLAVEATRAQQRRVQDVRAVGGGDQDHAALDVEAVHLDQQLVESLLALVVAAAETRTAVPADGVDLVDEDDRRGVRLGLLEEVADAARADTHEHLDEVGAGDGVERHARLTRDRAGEQGLAGPGRAVEQHALRDLGADGLELGRLLQELLDLVELLHRLVRTGDVREGRLRGVLGEQLGLGLAELHDPRAATLHLVHQEEEDQHDDDDRQHRQQQADEGALLLRADGVALGKGVRVLVVDLRLQPRRDVLALVPDVRGLELAARRRLARTRGREARTVLQLDLDSV